MPKTTAHTTSNKTFDPKKFIEELKKRGRTDQEIAQLLAGTTKLTALDLYVAMMTTLSDEQFAELDKLSSEEDMEKRAEAMFQEKTGMTLDELADQLQSGMLKAAEEAGREEHANG